MRATLFGVLLGISFYLSSGSANAQYRRNPVINVPPQITTGLAAPAAPVYPLYNLRGSYYSPATFNYSYVATPWGFYGSTSGAYAGPFNYGYFRNVTGYTQPVVPSPFFPGFAVGPAYGYSYGYSANNLTVPSFYSYYRFGY